ncbi:MAG: glucose 1-dehydrogenase [Senegalia sp. (in: firmicutes)]|uniref:glucose 1-dehydrogenase n=1 Tax=Senegalia sp. (in: firmicutes) TaxID=1924098 RepID=UPI003F9C93A0
MRLENKVCIVTGASSGIGREVALAYAKEGAKVVVSARRLEKLEELVKLDEDLSGEIHAIAVDVSKQEDIEKMVDQTVEKYGRVDILVNNAGILDSYKSAVSITDDIWEKMFKVNVDSVMRASRKVLPLMRKQKSGVILNTASVGGLNGMRGGLAYVATKHAVVGMTKHIGYSYAEEGIRCVGIAPGSVKTEIGENIKEPDMEVLGKLMKGFESFSSTTSPQELAKVYVFLASEDANFINGTTIVVDGGWTAF